MALEAGTRLGTYEILSPLGAGGMGEVYRARDAKLGRDVAVKVLPDAFASDADRLGRFEREARLLAALNHPNIAAIHDFHEAAGKRFIVMELIEGQTLSERIDDGPIPVDEALPLFVQIAEALEAAHERDIVHRDLKPSNIKITDDGKAKVLDFGLAKAMGGDSTVTTTEAAPDSPTITAPPPAFGFDSTREGAVLGTAPYMSPEQARGRSVNTRADIWAFGVCLFEALTGNRTFKGETTTDLFADIIRGEPDWTSLPPDTPPTICLLLRRCLTKDRKRRLQYVADARIELQAVIADPTSASLALTTSALQQGSAGASPARRAATLAAGLVIGVALTAAALWILRPTATPMVQRYSMRIPDELTVRSSLWYPKFDVSSDGNRLAFSATSEDGTSRLYIRDADQLEPRVLGRTDGASFPVLSPDGEWIAFRQNRRIKKMSLRGGPSVTLCDAENAGGLTWADDGHILFSTGWGPTATLMRVSENGGQAASVFSDGQDEGKADSQGYARWPEALPGGDVILYVTRTGRAAANEIHALIRSTGERKPLLNDASFPRYSASGHLLFMRKGTLMAVPFDPESVELRGQPIPVVEGVTSHPSGAGQVAVARDGTLILMLGGSTGGEERSLVKVGMDGKTEALSTHRRSFGRPRIASDGQRVATVIRAEEGAGWDVWILELERGVLTPLTTTRSATTPVWSPDGRWVYFKQDDNDGGGNGIWRQRADGSGSAELVLESSDEDLEPCSMSHDGRRLFVERAGAVVEGGEAHRDIAVIHLEDEGARMEDLVTTPANEVDPMVSPDGAWIAYTSLESGQAEIFVRPATGGGARVQVSTSTGYLPNWSPDGKKLYFDQAQSRMVVDVLEDEATEVGQAERRFRVSVPRELFARDSSLGFPYDVLPDGEGFLNTSSEAAAGDAEAVVNELIVTFNFFEELKRLAPPASRKN